MDFDSRLEELGLTLPNASRPQGNYTSIVQTGNLLFVSGKGPAVGIAEMPKGKLGKDYSVEEGYRFARLAGLDILATLKSELGSLNLISRVVKLQGFVNATEEFERHPQVLDGCSDLMVEYLVSEASMRALYLGRSPRGQICRSLSIRYLK